MKPAIAFSVIVAGALLTACATHGLDSVPPVQQSNLATIGKLQLAVGTATLSDGTIGLNTVTTLRQASGASAVLVDSPTFAGPSGFVIPSPAPAPSCAPLSPCTAGFRPRGDAGTSSLTSMPQNPNPLGTPAPALQPAFQMSGGVFGAGFAPFNLGLSSNGYNSAAYPGNPMPYGLPFFDLATAQRYIVGPPAVPFFNDGTYPSGFAGYLAGFTAMKATPVTGTYSLNVQVAAANAPSGSYAAQANLSSINPLPPVSKPVFTSDGAGGGTATVNVGTDPRTVETLLFVRNAGQGTYYTVGPVAGNGTLTFTLPDNLGPCTVAAPGCQNGPNAGHTICNATICSAYAAGTQDAFWMYAASFDYAQFEAEPPGNTSQTPTITGASGQADVSLSPATGLLPY